jgi:hypothetical protein
VVDIVGVFWVYVYMKEVVLRVGWELVWCFLLAEVVYCDGTVGLACWGREV